METVTVETIVKGDIKIVWDFWTAPQHIVKWAFASDDWECTNATNDLRVGGIFSSTMGAKDKSASFDFGGVYTAILEGKYINYTLNDGRKVTIDFKEEVGCIHIVEEFEPENENPKEMQRAGWQAILDNFKNVYVSRLD